MVTPVACPRFALLSFAVRRAAPVRTLTGEVDVARSSIPLSGPLRKNLLELDNAGIIGTETWRSLSLLDRGTQNFENAR